MKQQLDEVALGVAIQIVNHAEKMNKVRSADGFYHIEINIPYNVRLK